MKVEMIVREVPVVLEENTSVMLKR